MRSTSIYTVDGHIYHLAYGQLAHAKRKGSKRTQRPQYTNPDSTRTSMMFSAMVELRCRPRSALTARRYDLTADEHRFSAFEERGDVPDFVPNQSSRDKIREKERKADNQATNARNRLPIGQHQPSGMGDDTGCACCQLERQVISEPNGVPMLMTMQNRSRTFTASLSV